MERSNLTAMLFFVLIFLTLQLLESAQVAVESNSTVSSTTISDQASEKCAQEVRKHPGS